MRRSTCTLFVCGNGEPSARGFWERWAAKEHGLFGGCHNYLPEAMLYPARPPEMA